MTLEDRLEAQRFKVLERLAALPNDAAAERIRYADGKWKAFRRRVHEVFNEDPMADADPDKYLRENVYMTAVWKRFIKMRDKATKATERYKANQKAYDDTTRKANRRKPEVRTKMNSQRRARYARQRAERAATAAILACV